MYRTTFKTGFQKPLRMPLLEVGHPLAQGLVLAWLFTEGGGVSVRDASGNGNHGVLTNEDPSLAWRIDAGPGGPCIFLNGAGATTGVTLNAPFNQIPLPNAAFSVGVRYRVMANPAGTATVWGITALSGVTELDYVGGTSFQVSKSGGTALAAAAAIPAAGIFHDVLFVSGSQSPQETLYVDDNAPVTAAVAQDAVAPTQISIAQEQFGTQNVTGSFEYFYIWNRALSADEHRLLRCAPYDMFSLI